MPINSGWKGQADDVVRPSMIQMYGWIMKEKRFLRVSGIEQSSTLIRDINFERLQPVQSSWYPPFISIDLLLIKIFFQNGYLPWKTFVGKLCHLFLYVCIVILSLTVEQINSFSDVSIDLRGEYVLLQLYKIYCKFGYTLIFHHVNWELSRMIFVSSSIYFWLLETMKPFETVKHRESRIRVVADT